jgi:phi13 family phage major tail protein
MFYIGGKTMSTPIEEYRGIRGLKAAILLSDTDTELTYDSVFDVAGTAELSRTTENSSEAHYYDNMAAVVVDGVGADTVTASVSAIPLDVLAKITGQYLDPTTGTLVEGNATRPYLAIGYITDNTAGQEMYVWRHKVKASIPDSQHNTKTNGTEANGQQITFTGINTIHKFTKTGKTAKAVIQPAGDLISESAFFATPQNIDTLNALAPAITALTVSPTSGSVALGSTLTITATKTPATATTPVTWESMDTSIATVADGVVTPVAAGGVTIKATCGGKTATCSVIVTEE